MKLHGCHNKPDRLPTLLVQDGWTKDGRRVTQEIEDRMTPGCGHVLRETDPACSGCRHREGAR